jgi:P-type E1-E2 ATPase
VEVHPRDLVVGDIFCVEEGIQISCDGLLLKGSEVKTDESAMTGETDDIKKESIEKCMKLLNEMD